MSPRTGRPIIGERKDNDVKVRLDKTTHTELLKYCAENNKTKAEVIRMAIRSFLGLK